VDQNVDNVFSENVPFMRRVIGSFTSAYKANGYEPNLNYQRDDGKIDSFELRPYI
jgi:hypothetical protein